MWAAIWQDIWADIWVNTLSENNLLSNTPSNQNTILAIIGVC
jgi:hypothetical protein